MNLDVWENVWCSWLVWLASEIGPKGQQQPTIKEKKDTWPTATPPFKQTKQRAECEPTGEAHMGCKIKELPWCDDVSDRGFPPRITG